MKYQASEAYVMKMQDKQLLVIPMFDTVGNRQPN